MKKSLKPGDRVKHSGDFLKSIGMVSDQGRRATVIGHGGIRGIGNGTGFTFVRWDGDDVDTPIRTVHLMRA